VKTVCLADMSKEAKRYIQSCAWTFFPATELWITDTNKFCALDYDEKSSTTTITEGFYQKSSTTANGEEEKKELSTLLDSKNITFNTYTVNKTMDDIIENLILEGYKCFAMQLRE
jgi:hypothetical protein